MPFLLAEVERLETACLEAPHDPLWLVGQHGAQQAYRYAVAAIDEVQLAGLAAGLEAESWADGFRQGWLAAREAVKRRALLAVPPKASDE